MLYMPIRLGDAIADHHISSDDTSHALDNFVYHLLDFFFVFY